MRMRIGRVDASTAQDSTISLRPRRLTLRKEDPAAGLVNNGGRASHAERDAQSPSILSWRK
jgi:hypothetical protein